MGDYLGSAVWGIYAVDLLGRMATSQPAHYTLLLFITTFNFKQFQLCSPLSYYQSSFDVSKEGEDICHL